MIPEPAGLVLAPFRGVRYTPDRVSGLAEVTSPPYDVLRAAAAERLRAGDPHNVVRLTLPADGDGEGDGRPPDRYGVAGRTLRKWIADGVLVPDPKAALYVYEERDHGLALLVDSNAYPPLIDPIHRVVADLPPATAAELAAAAVTVRTLPSGTDLGRALRVLRDAGHAWEAATPDKTAPGGAGPNGSALNGTARHAAGPGAGDPGAGGNRTAFLLAGDGAFRLLTDPDPVKLAAAPAGRSARWLRLDTSVLHELLLKEIWRIRGDQSAVRMVHQDAAAAIDAARPGGTAVICNPPQVTDVLALAARGEQMPRKSTSFGPKPRTGLVIRSFAYR